MRGIPNHRFEWRVSRESLLRFLAIAGCCSERAALATGEGLRLRLAIAACSVIAARLETGGNVIPKTIRDIILLSKLNRLNRNGLGSS